MTLAMGELAYFVDDFFCSGIIQPYFNSEKQHYNQTHFYNHIILGKSTLHNSL